MEDIMGNEYVKAHIPELNPPSSIKLSDIEEEKSGKFLQKKCF